MIFGMGTAWTRRWFAKPVDKGSIPSHASTPTQGREFFKNGMQRARTSSFWAGVEMEAEKHVNSKWQQIAMGHHAKHIEFATKCSDQAEKIKAISVEMSKLKRSKSLDP